MEVIPRLVLARNVGPQATDQEAGPGPTPGEIEGLARIAMTGELAAAAAFIGRLRARDVSLPRIYLELLAPTARLLGQMWSEDRCDFTSVTIGLCCLQQLVLENSHAFEPRRGRPGSIRRILLAAVPGEQHSLGLLIVGEFFRRQGWEVISGTGASAREIVATTRKQWFSMVGFSLTCESRIESLAALIHDIRRATRNPSLGVMVGGLPFAERPELAALVGADATAMDGQQAVLKAETLLALLTQET
jgi:methanogenic corrinoid protein MtbC1